MNDAVFQEALSFARQLSSTRSPYALCNALEIEVISDKQMHNDGYLVCEDGCKLIFVSEMFKILIVKNSLFPMR